MGPETIVPSRSILITGSTGIAAATARVLARQGHSLTIVSRTEKHCTDLIEELQSYCDIGYVAGDLNSAEVSEEAVHQAIQSFGRLDSVFNVAGISGRSYGDGPIHECTEDGWEITINTNARSTYRICHHALRAMINQPRGPNGNRGTVLNMSSVLASSPEPVHFATHAYAASKAAIIGLSTAMASFYAPFGISVNVVAPGLVETPMARRAAQDDTVRRVMETKQPLARGPLSAEDVAHLSAFMLCDSGAFMTGQVIGIDGGWSVSEAQYARD